MHQSEDSKILKIRNVKSFTKVKHSPEVVEVILTPYYETLESIPDKSTFYQQIEDFLKETDERATIALITSPIMAADFCSNPIQGLHLKLWIAVRTKQIITQENYINKEHCALLVFTRYSGALNHTKTRISYTYCSHCDKTTKDYGGKKHLYHEFGTMMSDVWRDIVVDFDGSNVELYQRLADVFGLVEYKYLNVYDLRGKYPSANKPHKYNAVPKDSIASINKSKLINDDCLIALSKIPSNSIDFIFADPPYNLNKKYESWDDGIDIQNYFEWCDQWLAELVRILKPGRTLAVLNIPQWAIRHFKFLNTVLDFQDWIVWEGLSMPVRMIMPAHYSILCFSKGKPRPLPSKIRKVETIIEEESISSIRENYCARPNCIKSRRANGIIDTEYVSNIWWDIHRLKHNSRRVDHPCQLPPLFMYRLISLFTNEDELILDPFNGVGTSTLSAERLDRKYVGIELSNYYHEITKARHKELNSGIDPFRKNNEEREIAKNSPVERLTKQKYEVSKKTLQLEVKKIAQKLGHIPTKDDIKNLSTYPIEFFENYFINWAEVTAAARTTGMTENRTNSVSQKERQRT